jgi:hypothetical protein
MLGNLARQTHQFIGGIGFGEFLSHLGRSFSEIDRGEIAYSQFAARAMLSHCNHPNPSFKKEGLKQGAATISAFAKALTH